MTDRLTPPQLRDLAALLGAYSRQGRELQPFFEHEAARREAEASNPCKDPGACEVGGCLSPSACQAAAGEREGPGSAAAPQMQRVNLAGVPDGCTYPLCDCHTSKCMKVVEDKPTPAADELSKHALHYRIDTEEMHTPESFSGYTPSWAQKGPMDKATETDAELAKQATATAEYLADYMNSPYSADVVRRLISRIEAQAREIAMWHAGANAATERANRNADERDAEKARADRLAAALNLVERQIEYQRNATTPATAQDWTERALSTIRAALSTEGGDRG